MVTSSSYLIEAAVCFSACGGLSHFDIERIARLTVGPVQCETRAWRHDVRMIPSRALSRLFAFGSYMKCELDAVTQILLVEDPTDVPLDSP